MTLLRIGSITLPSSMDLRQYLEQMQEVGEEGDSDAEEAPTAATAAAAPASPLTAPAQAAADTGNAEAPAAAPIALGRTAFLLPCCCSPSAGLRRIASR